MKLPVLSDYDIKLLRDLNGEKVDGLCWGAAMSESIEYLYNLGLANRTLENGTITYAISPRGRAALKEVKR